MNKMMIALMIIMVITVTVITTTLTVRWMIVCLQNLVIQRFIGENDGDEKIMNCKVDDGVDVS